MKLVRNNVFETNSSSSHSLSFGLSNQATDKSLQHMVKDGEIIVCGGEYGWGYESYNDAYNKLNYAVTELSLGALDNDEEEIRSLSKFIMLEEAVSRLTDGAKINLKEFIKSSSYIDHQSVGLLYNEGIWGSVDALEEYISNPNITLIIDNDNH